MHVRRIRNKNKHIVIKDAEKHHMEPKLSKNKNKEMILPDVLLPILRNRYKERPNRLITLTDTASLEYDSSPRLEEITTPRGILQQQISK